MKKLAYFFLLLLPASVLHAQKDSIAANQAQNFMGKNVLICDMIKEAHMGDVSKAEPTVLYTGESYENRTFALVFTRNVLQSFSFAPEKKMVNHSFCVHGKIDTYEGKPAIFVKSEAQLHVEE